MSTDLYDSAAIGSAVTLNVTIGARAGRSSQIRDRPSLAEWNGRIRVHVVQKLSHGIDLIIICVVRKAS